MATERLVLQIDEKGAVVVSRKIDDIGKSAKGAGGALQLLKRALGALAVAAVIKQFVSLADTFTVIQNKLKIVTTGTENLAAVTDELFQIAKRTRSSFEATADSYSKFALSAKELGRSQAEVLRFTELVNKAVIIGGSTASEAAGGLRQLAQGIASGALRGDELISVLENLPFVADTIAKELGITRGELRKLGAEGKITADIVLDAFKNQADFLEGEYAKTTITVGQGFQLIKNSVLGLVGGFDSATGVSAKFAQVLVEISEFIDTGLAPALEFLQDVGSAVFTEIQAAIEPLAPVFAKIAELAPEVAKVIGLAFVATVRTAAETSDAIARLFGKLFNFLDENFGDIFEGIITLLADFVNKALGLIQGLIEGFRKGIDAVRKFLGQEPLDAFDLIQIDPIAVGQIGRNLGRTIADGLESYDLTGVLDRIISSVEDAQLKRQLERARETAAANQSAIQTEGGEAATSPAQRDAALLVEKTIQGLQREQELIFLTNKERERALALDKLRAELAKTGQTLGEGDAATITALLEENDALEEQARILNEIKGPQIAYQNALRALDVLLDQGKINQEEYTAALKELKKELRDAESDPNILGLGQALKVTFDQATSSLLEFTRTGKFEIRSFAADVLEQFARIAAAQAFQRLGGAFGLPGFATGGQFTVGGSGGTDSQTVAFRATPGEQVTITRPGQQQAATMAVPSTAAPQMNVKVVNVLDPNLVVDAMSSTEGEEVIINTISRNPSVVRQAIS